MKAFIALACVVSISCVCGRNLGKQQQSNPATTRYGEAPKQMAEAKSMDNSKMASGYGMVPQAMPSGYGMAQQMASGYGMMSQPKMPSSGYGNPGQVNFKSMYNIELPQKGYHGHANWGVQLDNRNAKFQVNEMHPYGGKSNVHYIQNSSH